MFVIIRIIVSIGLIHVKIFLLGYILLIQRYAFVLGNDMSVFKPKNYKSFTKGEYHFLCKAKIEKEYIDELPEGINLSLEDYIFYVNRPQCFKLLNVYRIKNKIFCLTINLVEQTIQFKSAGIKEEGKLTCFYYL